MKTYSLLKFLSEPIHHILDNEEDYCFQSLKSNNGLLEIDHKSISKINIPIIQRDYVQGRAEYKELREGFIAKLFNHLESEKELKLDFIYGSLDRLNGNVFLPLDGQQRLTTLYLLHWYIIKKEASKEEFQKRYKVLLSKFCYETRDTSRRFFKELVAFDFEGNPKDNIVKAYWFNDHFALDPTVSAAINTLETIHEVYSVSNFKGTLLEKLTKNYIVFYILPMDQFKLTDDLYIKLNARGKVLSSFENFKADIVGFLKTIPEFNVEREYKDESFKRFDILASKFDNDWTNLFWQKAQNDNIKKKSIDRYFFRFIHRLLINDYLLDYTESEINKDPIYKELLNKEANLKYSNFELYEQNKLVDNAFLNKLETLLDFYLIHFKDIQKYVTPFWMNTFTWSIYDDNYTMNHRMIFDAINQYILYNSNSAFDEDLFKEWMRIVWNLISDPDNRSIEANKTVMTVVREIAKFSGKINAELVNDQLDCYIDSLKNIYREQLIEEKLKAQLICSDQGRDWKECIYEAESHKLFTGNIGFLLEDAQSPIHLKTRYSIASQLFNDKGAKEYLENEKYSLNRYIISQLDTWDSLNKFNFLASEIIWKTNLRRSKVLKDVLIQLIDLTELNLIFKEIEEGLKRNSKLQSANTKERIAHKNLYADSKFHEWMQDDGANKLRWREHHIYAIRPNAWYSKVMIDGFRNELITALIDCFQIKDVKNRCGSSNYYWEEKFDYFKKVDDKTVTFHFDIHNKLYIGLWGDLNSHIANVNNRTDGWIEVHSFEIDKITSEAEIEFFINDIEETICGDSKSLITKLFLELSN